MTKTRKPTANPQKRSPEERRLRSIRAQQKLLKLRGKVKFSLDLAELREDRE